MEIRCNKCGCVMVDDSSFQIKAYRCYNCGNRQYLGYPKRPGAIEICHICGKEFERKRAIDILCDTCRESDRFVLSNRKRRAKKTHGGKGMTLKREQVIKKIATAAAKKNIDIRQIDKLRLLCLVRIMTSSYFHNKSVADELIDRFFDEEEARA